jgi:hypothetical protein
MVYMGVGGRSGQGDWSFRVLDKEVEMELCLGHKKEPFLGSHRGRVGRERE